MPHKKLEERVLAQVDPAELIRHVERISAVDRESGEPGDWQAVDYVAGYLQRLGVPVTVERIRALVSMPRRADVRLDDESTVDCITHAYAASTPSEGVRAQLVELDPESDQDLRRKIVVLRGLASPVACYQLERRGAAGLVFINSGDFPHNMAISPVWGMPVRRDFDELAKIPVVSVNRDHGQRLVDEIRRRDHVTATMVTHVETSLRDLPLCVADVVATGAGHDRYVLLNGHIDSWHKGAVDNGTGNAAMLEIARILSLHRDSLSTHVRLVWWSGHSNGRYSGSDWYADHHWEDLHSNAVVNFNIDSVGARGATHYGRVDCSAQCYDAGWAAINDLTGQDPSYSRIARNGDQSFWGHGVPSLFQVLSLQPPEQQEPDTFVPGLPWYWHTTEDVVEHVGPDELALDCKIYLAAVWRFCAGESYPFTFTKMAEEIIDNLAAAQELVADAYSFREHLDLATGVLDQMRWFDRARESADAAVDRDRCEKFNALSMRINRIVIPVHYCATSPFRTDSALPSSAFPGLPDLTLLHQHDSEVLFESHRREVVREGNRIRRMLLELTDLLAGARETDRP